MHPLLINRSHSLPVKMKDRTVFMPAAGLLQPGRKRWIKFLPEYLSKMQRAPLSGSPFIVNSRLKGSGLTDGVWSDSSLPESNLLFFTNGDPQHGPKGRNFILRLQRTDSQFLSLKNKYGDVLLMMHIFSMHNFLI